MKGIKSIYIHIPFCQTICSYCDFCKIFYNQKLTISYLKELEKEILDNYKGEEISTIYIGGGTPTSLSYDELSFLFYILKKIKLSNDYEFTIEANIDSLNIDKIKLLKENGVNRISIGVETFNNNYQKLINRELSLKELANTIQLLKDNDIININLDLMYGFKNETIEILDKDLEKSNYKHYEISNYAKAGYESRHNLVYWNNDEYYGFGLSASSYCNNIRKTNTRSINNYLNGKREVEKEKLSLKDKMDYEIMLGLRLEKGVSKEQFLKKYNINLEEVYNYQKLLDNAVLTENDKYLYVNKNYRYVLNEILSEIL